MTTAGPNERAGFMLAPVNLICANIKILDTIITMGCLLSFSPHDTYRHQMSDSNRKANGQRNRSLDVRTTFIANGVHNEDEHKSDQGLDEHCLAETHKTAD